MSLVLGHLRANIWSTKISNQMFLSGHFTTFPSICEALTFWLLTLTRFIIDYHFKKYTDFYYSGVFSVPSIPNTFVLLLGKHKISK